MKIKRLRLVIVLLGIVFFGRAHAQSFLQINFKQNDNREFSLDAIQSLTYENEKLVVNIENNQSFSFPIESLRSFLFVEEGTDVPIVQGSTGFELVVYPNPIDKMLNIRLPDAPAISGIIMLYNNNGQLVHQEPINAKQEISMNVSHLPQGLYLCRYSNEGVVKTVKFIKK